MMNNCSSHKFLSVIMLILCCVSLLATLVFASCTKDSELNDADNDAVLEMVLPNVFELNGNEYEIDYDLSDIIYDRESGTFNFEQNECVAALLNESECEAFSAEYPSISCVISDSVYMSSGRNIVPVYSVEGFKTSEIVMLCPHDIYGMIYVGPDGGAIHDTYLAN
ncbi:MAG: hypothetical protein LUE27_11150 [Clostridia bacterium]|nr:hypothetical protein [Clostridia bacterium]